MRILNFWFNDEWVVLKRAKARLLSVASQKITDEISVSGANEIKRIEAKIFKKSENCALTTIPQPWFLVLFIKEKNKDSSFRWKGLIISLNLTYKRKNSEPVNRQTPNSTIKMDWFINDEKTSTYFNSMLYKVIQ